MMNIELLDGENEIRLTGGPMTLEGIYVSAARYAEENDVSEEEIRVWKKRGRLNAVTIFGRIYVKKGSIPETRRYRKTSHIDPKRGK